MAANVRIFYFDGLVTGPVAAGTRYTTDSVGMLKYPYLASSPIAATSSPQSSTAAPAGTRIAYVQVQAGKAIHLEVNPPNRTTDATTDSPVLTGSDTFVIGPSWSLSVIESTE